jgi:signal transduction histidine kinase
MYAVAIERVRYQEEIDIYELHIEELVEERTSELIRANRQLQESERKARDLSNQVLQMLMIMSHDIRGPLVSMGAILKLLLRDTYGRMEESVKNAVRELMSRTANLIHIAEDCLGKARDVGNEGGDGFELLDLRQDVIDCVLDELVEDMERNGVRIDNRLGEIPAGKIQMRGNKVWLRAIYRNLFGNAIKHGGQGCTIAFGFEDRGTHYRLNVYNTGNPVPEGERSNLFTRFGRAQSSECAMTDGMGVGLFLICEYLQKMGGDIWYEAKPDGSDFIFTIPKQQ